jgi:phage baseplate assembly protein V
MISIADIQRLVAPLHRQIVNLAVRAVVKTIDDAKKMQLLQVEALDGETRDNVEHFHPYGLSSSPKDGAEAILLRLNGTPDNGVVVCVSDRRHRIKNLESGEVVVYDATGSKVLLKANGDIEVTPSSGKAKLTGDLHVTGKLDVDGKGTFSDDVDCSGTVTGSSDVVGGGIHLKTHTHKGSSTVCGTSGSPWTGETDAPT